VSWYRSAYTGLFSSVGELAQRAADPQVPMFAGSVPAWGARTTPLEVGGAGWSEAQAQGACLGEAIERCQAQPLPGDLIVQSSYRDWDRDEPAVSPDRWVLFHPEQYRQPDFPFQAFGAEAPTGWVCFREAASGQPRWVPLDLAFLQHGAPHTICPGVSTGLGCGRWGDPLLLRGAQEVVERDALMGAWWGRYGVEEWGQAEVLDAFPEASAARFLRPNLTYRFYRIDSPFSAHVTLVTLSGEDREGWCFSVGSACREARGPSWRKAVLEAVQGRTYVRYLLGKLQRGEREAPDRLSDFEDHALYSSVHPEHLKTCAFERASSELDRVAAGLEEGLEELGQRLGADRPILFRNMTPPGIAQEIQTLYVLKVLIPGLQPLHGVRRLAQLGGPLWAPAGLAELDTVSPHPFA
jgi:thiazole/oxazole-forming peptide maturase SagD family component